MGIPVLILGESGSGKSTSMQFLNAADGWMVNPENKRLPFKSKDWTRRDPATKQGNVFFTDVAKEIIIIINHARRNGKKYVVIDDFQYVMANKFMRKRSEKSYEKFTEIGGDAWDIIRAAQSVEDDLIVYFMAHTEETAGGRIKMKTIGKMLDEKITVEGMFSIALRTASIDGNHYFTTQTDGSDPVKTPIGMFEQFQIDNDLNAVDTAIREYYEL